MTPEQYWEGDCTLTVAYREAYKLRQEEINRRLWLQGYYIYEALCDVSPVLNAFAKNGTKPQEYRSEPIALTKSELEERRERDERRRYEAMIAATKEWAEKRNKTLAAQKAKEVSKDGRKHD